ncbi:hypothetical protein DERP_003640 [Dermatophagoides pteronyssinus]|uniref:Uncharacterized protein n=1 Tax=Dermatophagoides pteronyssinus TaxID=6956 RepID=A0ABQ8JL70_DERPT|nr:hypothetical protein DERP_003640 [Dermatophagoides pteronyssinus]
MRSSRDKRPPESNAKPFDNVGANDDDEPKFFIIDVIDGEIERIDNDKLDVRTIPAESILFPSNEYVSTISLNGVPRSPPCRFDVNSVLIQLILIKIDASRPGFHTNVIVIKPIRVPADVGAPKIY